MLLRRSSMAFSLKSLKSLDPVGPAVASGPRCSIAVADREESFANASATTSGPSCGKEEEGREAEEEEEDTLVGAVSKTI
mmetsp:Transcript_48230/g.40832  ORF Transcript_48230/g.40832 Transcript_48230/m.40832 type:complete len:80 (-) Transcript_48230:357-596(-)